MNTTQVVDQITINVCVQLVGSVGWTRVWSIAKPYAGRMSLIMLMSWLRTIESVVEDLPLYNL